MPQNVHVDEYKRQ